MATTADVAIAETLPLDDLYGSAPVSKRRMRRSLVLYGVLFIVGLSPVLLDAAVPWQAFGLGLLFPGGGFLAVGGWAYVLFPIALVLMLVACALMLLTANAFAPLLIWLGSAALAGALVPSELAPLSVYIVPLLSLGFMGWVIDKHRRLARAEYARRDVRNAYLPRAEQDVLARATPRPAIGSRELSAEDLAHLRFALDRGLQPIESFGGFHVIEQFQTSSLRYQINNLLWALQLAQCHYTPNFHGYLSQAQRNLIDKLTVPKVWKWWRWESLFGNFSLSANPIAKDNIMFGGFSSAHIALYTANTGDDRYLQPGSLPFRLNRFRTYQHNLQTILAAGKRNHETAVYGPLYPCEPNLTYSACNLQGNFAHLVADRIFSTQYRQTLIQQLKPMHVSEMMCRDGMVHAGRVVPFGIRIPVYTSSQVEALWGWMANAFFPDLSRRVWATLRQEYVSFDERGEITIATKSYDRMDMGNYQKSECGPYTQFLVLAREQGDDQVAEAILRKFERDFGRLERDGSISYTQVSTYNMGHMIFGRIGRTGDIRAMVLDGPPPAAMKGPLLAEVRYPDVLVAKAFSSGADLQLVLYPGAAASRQRLQIERLEAGREYRMESGTDSKTFRADANGKAAIEIDLAGRTEVHIQPLQS
ncbi:MAG: hypothetical protein ABW034_22975 [Steroidobacteraceae bacterium]